MAAAEDIDDASQGRSSPRSPVRKAEVFCEYAKVADARYRTGEYWTLREEQVLAERLFKQGRQLQPRRARGAHPHAHRDGHHGSHRRREV